MKLLTSVKFIVPSLVLLAALIAVVTLLAPMDRVLGQATRMVYLHGALIRVVLERVMNFEPEVLRHDATSRS